TSYRLLEHLAERHTINDSALDPESDDSPCVLVHDDQHPIGLQCDRFTTEQVEAPQTILHMADERQPRGTVFRRRRRILGGENSPNHVLINTRSESQIDLFCNLRTSPRRIAPFHLDHGPDQIPPSAPSDPASFSVLVKTAKDTCAARWRDENSGMSTA